MSEIVSREVLADVTLQLDPNPIAKSSSSQGSAPAESPTQSLKDKPDEAHKQLPSCWFALPNTAFAIVLGFGGNSILWKTLAHTPFTSDVGTAPNWFFWIGGIAMLGIVMLLYGIKLARQQTRSLVWAEWQHPIRRYFFVVPHLAALMLTLGTPKSIFVKSDARWSWGVCFALQFATTTRYYIHWMYSEHAHLENAGAPYLLSTVGWLLLAKLAQTTQLRAAWGFDLGPFCFGIGMFFYLLALIAIFLGLHKGAEQRGAPALFLIIAPAAVASLVMEDFEQAYGITSRALFGFTFLMFCVLVVSGPQLLVQPKVPGFYWAYTFPLAALATCSVDYANAEDRNAPKVFSWGLVGVATLGFTFVVLREGWHQMQVMRGVAEWKDPIAIAYYSERNK